MLEKIITGAAGAVVAVLIISVATAFTDWIDVLFKPTVPDGAVVAFPRPCQEVDGWKDYEASAGRFLLGVGEGIALRSQGGEAAHRLTIEEMPEHNHGPGKYLVKVDGHDTVHAKTDASRGEINIRHGVEIGTAGGGQPHNNMPPYIALHFCQKTG
ncbi:MAG: hypothetical protein OXL41_01330 [Nitrospinae bacterium]|nr:hypothetical protein [Nitrospinota bacterium]